MSDEKHNQYGGFMAGRQSLDDVLYAMYETLPPEFSQQAGNYKISIRFIPANEYGYVDEVDRTVWKVTKDV